MLFYALPVFIYLLCLFNRPKYLMGIITYEKSVLGRRNSAATARVWGPVQWTQVGPYVNFFSLFDFLKGIAE